ncbi:MAG: hypothetical protein JWO77_273 [Ilumatobacteraceae bacterium]|nr:hypothetical protein [Ilumatobacteraceae bacterium]
MFVGTAKKGVLVELGTTELLLARSRFGAASDRIEAAGYGDALTVEVVEAPDAPGGTALSRVGIERSIRQSRVIHGALHRKGSGFELRPADGSAPFAALVLDRLDPDALVGTDRPWSVGAPYRDIRMIEPADASETGRDAVVDRAP